MYITSEAIKSIEQSVINHQAVNSHWTSGLLEFPLLQWSNMYSVIMVEEKFNDLEYRWQTGGLRGQIFTRLTGLKKFSFI